MVRWEEVGRFRRKYEISFGHRGCEGEITGTMLSMENLMRESFVESALHDFQVSVTTWLPSWLTDMHRSCPAHYFMVTLQHYDQVDPWLLGVQCTAFEAGAEVKWAQAGI